MKHATLRALPANVRAGTATGDELSRITYEVAQQRRRLSMYTPGHQLAINALPQLERL
jgi:hypothetical protein